MFRVPFHVALVLAIAFAGGIYTAIAAIEADDPFDTVTIGPWQASPLAQTAAANPYAKARRARTPGLALGQAEGLVFTAGEDSEGARLRGVCAYRVSGDIAASRLWLMRLVAPDGTTLAAGPGFPATLHSHAVLRDPSGEVTLRLSQQPRAGNWLKLPNDGPFLIELSLFDTPAAGNFGLVDLAMPEIERLDCADA